MTAIQWGQLALFTILLLLMAKPLGLYMTAVYEGRRTLLSPVLRPVEAGVYRLAGVREDDEQDWWRYLVAVLGFSVLGFLLLYIWVRATLPRMRYDRLMGFGWKVLLPVSLLNVCVTAVLVAYNIIPPLAK